MASMAASATTSPSPSPPLPPGVVASLERSQARFLKHIVGDDVNADGNPWVVEKKSDRLVVRGAQAKDNNVRMFRVTFWVRTTHPDGINQFLTELMDMAKRPEWDKTIKYGETRFGYDDEEEKGQPTKTRYELVEYTTNSVAGGLISPRWFLDARKTFQGADGTSYCVTTDGGDAGLVACQANHVQAKNYEGSCSMLKPVRTEAGGAVLWKCENLAHCNINGYLPMWVVNRETGSAMMGTYTLLLKNLCEVMGDALVVVDPAEFV